jgi:hypothetical protein
MLVKYVFYISSALPFLTAGPFDLSYLAKCFKGFLKHEYVDIRIAFIVFISALDYGEIYSLSET